MLHRSRKCFKNLSAKKCLFLRPCSCKFSRAYNSCFFLILLQHKPGFALVGSGMIGVPPTTWFPPPSSHKSRCNTNGVPSPLKNESPTENEPPIHWNMKSPLKKRFLEKNPKAANYHWYLCSTSKITLEKNWIICNLHLL